MATATVPVSSEAMPRPPVLTAADLAALPTSLPSGDVCYELQQGSLIIMAPAVDGHSIRQGRIFAELYSQCQKRGLGEARVESTIILARNPDTVVVADVAFILAASLPVQRSREGYLITIPELVVEVRSKNDTLPYVQAKVHAYLAAGVQVVWVVDEMAGMLTTHAADGTEQRFTTADVVTCTLLPGFALPLADVLAASAHS